MNLLRLFYFMRMFIFCVNLFDNSMNKESFIKSKEEIYMNAPPIICISVVI